MSSRRPPPGLIAEAEHNHQALIERMAKAVAGARLLLAAHDTEVEAFAELNATLSRSDPRIAIALGAAAIMELAKQPDQGRAAG